MQRDGSMKCTLGAAVLLTAGLAAAAAAQGERHELSGESVALYNLAGRVTLEATGGSAVQVAVTRHGSDAERLRVEQGMVSGRQTLRIVYPETSIRYREGGGRTQLRVRDDGTFGNGDGGRRVTIDDDSGSFEAWADLTVGVPRGQTLSVYQAAGSVTVTNVHGDLVIDTHSADVSTTGTAGPLSVDVGSGDILVTDADGTVELDTGSGDVVARGVRGDLLYVDTGSGDVTAEAVQVRDLRIDTGSGDVEVDNGSASDITIDTGSGTVEVDLSDSPDEVAIDTGSGSVTVRVPASYSARVNIETSSGDIDLEFPLQVSDWERNEVSGTIGSGQGRLTIDTGSGSVSLLKRG